MPFVDTNILLTTKPYNCYIKCLRAMNKMFFVTKFGVGNTKIFAL